MIGMYSYIQGNGGGQRASRIRNKPRLRSSSSKRKTDKDNSQKALIKEMLIKKSGAEVKKRYVHVPCKFFRQGACQAGEDCPFSHSVNVLTAEQTPCKYFEKGNCKFGDKCVNAHIMVRNGELLEGRNSNYNGSRSKGKMVIMASEQKSNCVVTDYEDPLIPVAPAQSKMEFADSSLHSSLSGFEEEVLVPGELSDLLSPRQLRRRNSKSSFNAKKLGCSDSMSTPSTKGALLSTCSSSHSETQPLMHCRTWSSISNTSPPPSVTSHVTPLLTEDYTFQQSCPTTSSMGRSPWNTVGPGGGGSSSYDFNTSVSWIDNQLRHLMEDLTGTKFYDKGSNGGSDNTIFSMSQKWGFRSDISEDTQFLVDSN